MSRRFATISSLAPGRPFAARRLDGADLALRRGTTAAERTSYGTGRAVAACGKLVDSRRFDAVMLSVILANAIALGAQTFDGLGAETESLLELANQVMLAVFGAELLVRITAVGWRPRRFLASGWNSFDLVVVAASFVPGVNASLLLILRLLRIVRSVRFLPDLRILATAVRRSVPGVASLAAASLLLIYVYGMFGWMIFADHDPEHFGHIGQAMTTMFVLLTLESLPDYIEMGLQLSGWTIAFFISYVLVASFLVFNLFIGIVINSMEEARSIELRRTERERLERSGETGANSVEALMRQRLRGLHQVVTELESDLEALARRSA